MNVTYEAGRSCMAYWRHILGVICRSPAEKTTVLTRANMRVVMITRWEVNITRKYHVASSTIVPRILETSSPCFFDVLAKKTIKENVRNSE